MSKDKGRGDKDKGREDDGDDEDERSDAGGASEREGLGGRASEMMRKMLTLGVGTAILTEESLRGLVSELKLPKELMAGILKQANESKKDFMQGLTVEMLSRLKDKVDPAALVQEILHKNDIDVQLTIKFWPRKEKDGKDSKD